MAKVTVEHWNPRRSRFGGRLGRLLAPVSPRSDNFGDLLGPMIVTKMLATRGVDDAHANADARLLAVGSIMHFAKSGDHVWGAGVNGKVPVEHHTFDYLDVRAVRGPLTRRFLQERGIAVPEVYGDPALLLAKLDPRLHEWAGQKRFDVTIVPNLHDAKTIAHDVRVVQPTQQVDRVLEQIARSRMVVGSSLHGVIIAESLGIPARLIEPSREDPFKYTDYYRGTGRSGFTPATTVAEAIDLGGEPPIAWDSAALEAAFPWDLWHKPGD